MERIPKQSGSDKAEGSLESRAASLSTRCPLVVWSGRSTSTHHPCIPASKRQEQLEGILYPFKRMLPESLSFIPLPRTTHPARQTRKAPPDKEACSVVLPRSYMHAKSLQLSLTLCNTMDYSPPGSSVHEILQAGILEWVAISSSRGSSPHRY